MGYDHSSGGIIALHRLAHNIALLGEQSFIYSCDLLSKCIFGLSLNNASFAYHSQFYVVICFQNVSLAYR